MPVVAQALPGSQPCARSSCRRCTEDVLRLAHGDGVNTRPVLVNAEAITALDSTAAQALGELLDELEEMAVPFGLARVKAPLHERLSAAGLLERIGEDHLYLAVDDGVAAMDREPEGE